MKIDSGMLSDRRPTKRMPTFTGICSDNGPTLAIFPKPLSKSFFAYNVTFTFNGKTIEASIIICYVIIDDKIYECWHSINNKFMEYYVTALYSNASDYVTLSVTKCDKNHLMNLR